MTKFISIVDIMSIIISKTDNLKRTLLIIILPFFIACSNSERTNQTMEIHDDSNESNKLAVANTLFTDLDKMLELMLSLDPDKVFECEYMLEQFEDDYFNNENFFKDDNAVTLLVSVVIALNGKVDDHKLFSILKKVCTMRNELCHAQRNQIFLELLKNRKSRDSNGAYMNDVANKKILHFLGVENFNLNQEKIDALRDKGYIIDIHIPPEK